MKVYLIRHGETVANREHRYQGHTNFPLSERGRASLVSAGFFPSVVYTSPLCRTAQTADILFPSVPQCPVSGLEEMDFGIFEGKTWRELSQSPDTKEEYQRWIDSGCLTEIPHGESRAEFCARVCAAFSVLVRTALERGDECLVIVAHGGTQLAALERFAVPRREYFDWSVSPGCGFVLETDLALWQRQKVLLCRENVCYTANNLFGGTD